MSEITGITNLATLTDIELRASMKDTDAMSVNISLGHPLANLTKGSLLGMKTSDSKYYDYDSGADDGTEVFRGILAVDMSSLAANQPTNIIISGDINRAACSSVVTVPTGIVPTFDDDGKVIGSINFIEEE